MINFDLQRFTAVPTKIILKTSGAMLKPTDWRAMITLRAAVPM